MRVLVTGGGGFIGSHLVDALAARGDRVLTLVRPGRSAPEHLSGHATVRAADLIDTSSILGCVRDFQPDAICHFAAQSLPAVSWEQPVATLHNNIAGALNLYDAARHARFSGPILVAGSSSEYAEQRDPQTPIDEFHPVGASSPYAVSKIAVDQLSQLYQKRHGLAIVRMRPFFWIGTRKVGDFCSDMARRVVRVESGLDDHIAVGNLDAVRDLLDVRDGVAGALVLLERGRAGEVYNVCSGTGMRMRDVLQLYTEMTPAAIRIEVDPAFLRPLDEPVRIGDARKLMTLGWRPSRPIKETLRDILAYWRERGP